MDLHWKAPAGLHTTADRLPFEGERADFGGATGWLNSPPLTPGDLRGRVVLVSFWTYTCVNWLRQLPYLRAWADKYDGHGLTVVGVHTPEFSFEHDPEQVRRAVAAMRIGYPVALDSDYGVWRAFDNHYWPALYFADAEGRIRHHHFGEGEYRRSEMVIQQLLADAGASGVDTGVVSPNPGGVEAAADWPSLRSPENYTGFERAEGFASPGGLRPGSAASYTTPPDLRRNQWAVAGSWAAGPEALTVEQAGGRLSYRFHARDLNLVLSPGPAGTGSGAGFQVRLDGQPPGAAHGADTDARGHGTVREPRLYQLIRQRGAVVDRTFEITFADPGVQAYVFTFG